MRVQEKERFDALCATEAGTMPEEGQIGTYGEKRLHRILKSWCCPDDSAHEQPVGRFVADILCEGRIVEIQTGSFYPLVSKLEYYLRQTEYDVTVVHPLIAQCAIYRIDRDSGELIRRRQSNKHERVEDLLPLLSPIAHLLTSPRLTVYAPLIRVEEHRYSERVRYRRRGAIEKEVFPRELLGDISLCGAESYRQFLPDVFEFTAAEYGELTRLRGRELSRGLMTLRAMGLLTREKEGNRYRYFRTP